LGSGASPASAADECPNVVFRTGPSAKLPECRAYELVSPAYTGGLFPTAVNFSFHENMFPYPLITPGGGDVIFQTVGGTIGNFPGTGLTDRYRSKRTANGWVTEAVGPTSAETPEPWPGGSSSDHDYYFISAGGVDSSREPNATLQAPFDGLAGHYLHKPNGEFELIATGSLGQARVANGWLITPGAEHVFFSTAYELGQSLPPPKQLESNAPTNAVAVYDRTPGGPTKVVSLLPGNVTPNQGAQYLGATPDGSEVAFGITPISPLNGFSSPGNIMVRRNNTTTVEAARNFDVPVGQQLTCTGGPGSATLSYQWLRNGAPIGGATSASYTTTAADEGKLVQCQVTAAVAEEGGSVATSQPKLVLPISGTNPPAPGSASVTGTPNVGQTLTCDGGGGYGSSTSTLSYQWLRNGAPIGGATSSTYPRGGADEGTSIQCRLTATNAAGTAVYHSFGTLIQALRPIATADPVITNVTDPGNPPTVAEQLSCASGTWSNSPTFTYQWLRNGTEIGGATSSSYTVVAEDEGKSLQCRVTGTNPDSTASAVSARLVADPQPGTAPPTLSSAGYIFGARQVGGTLSCEPGSWTGSPTFTYQWLRNGTEIGGATSSSYTGVTADRGTTVQCRVTATNAGGSTVAIRADQEGALYVSPAPPFANASLPAGELSFGGIFGGSVFYADAGIEGGEQKPGDLYTFDIDSGTTTRITNTQDARFVNVSDDGSHVYFVSRSQIGGQGTAGQPNLYVWSRADEGTSFIATVAASDADPAFGGPEARANLATWVAALNPKQQLGDSGLGMALSRTTPNGSVLAFISSAQLTAFDNDGHDEIYRYDTVSDDLSCVSCPPGGGPATEDAAFLAFGGGFLDPKPISHLTPPLNLTTDGDTVFFESEEDILPQDGNERRDVYRWKKGDGLALISTGQAVSHSYLYSMTPDGSDVVIATGQQLLPEDQNGGVEALYDARVNGGFPPPEKTVTEPCSGDACQGSPATAPSDSATATASLAGDGNVKAQAPKRCGRGKRKVQRKGRTRCVPKKKHHRASSNRRAAR
jgi:hypothetical protein